MNKKLMKYLDGVFSPYEDLNSVKELKEELSVDLQEKLSDFKHQGYDDETAFQMTIDSIGDIEEIVESITVQTKELKQMVRHDLSMNNLQDSDLRGVKVHRGKFDASALKGADFSTADLANSSYVCTDLKDVRFNGADLSGATFNMSALENASFECANLTGAKFLVSDLKGVRFDGANLSGVKFSISSLNNASFKGTILDNTEFSTADLSDVSFDNLTLHNTVFFKSGLTGTSFRNAILKNVSFKISFKTKKTIKKAIFDGATMDKLTFAVLKGFNANLTNVKVI
ncbi:MAG: pentapeptide repeat-containing protein [Bacillota bacterium]|nr:pentapeptide repeat-containing protein [Bacillota bacterium]